MTVWNKLGFAMLLTPVVALFATVAYDLGLLPFIKLLGFIFGVLLWAVIAAKLVVSKDSAK